MSQSRKPYHWWIACPAGSEWATYMIYACSERQIKILYGKRLKGMVVKRAQVYHFAKFLSMFPVAPLQLEKNSEGEFCHHNDGGQTTIIIAR